MKSSKDLRRRTQEMKKIGQRADAAVLGETSLRLIRVLEAHENIGPGEKT
jgi:hypothetical protein